MDYTINNYRFRKLGKKYLVTTDHGSYCFLSEEEFKALKQNRIDGELKEKLIEREIILDKTNIHEAERLMKLRNSFLFHGASLHIVVPTLRCNMKCVYCHASSVPEDEKGVDMNIETAEKTVDFIFQSPTSRMTIEFQGGEPMLNWDVVKHIIEYAQEKNKKAKKQISITMVTNMTVMDDEKLSYLIDNDVSLCTSLDGPKKIHDFNRKFTSGSSHEKAVYWIKRIQEEYEKRGIKERKVYALVTLTRKSLEDPEGIVDEYVNLGMDFIHLRFLNRLGIAKKSWQSITYTAEEYLEFWKKAVEYIKKLNEKGIKLQERMFTIMKAKVCAETDPNYLDMRSPCGAVIGQLAYNHNGDIYACDEARMIEDKEAFKIGNVKKDSYSNVTTCNKSCAIISSSINDQYVCNSCAYKSYCGICPVCNYAEQGSVIGKISQTDRCKIFKEQFDFVFKSLL